MIEENNDGLGDFGFDIDEDLLTDMEEAHKEVTGKEEEVVKEQQQEDTKQEEDSEIKESTIEAETDSDTKTEESEQELDEEDILEDDDIFEKYGNDVNPDIVRHFEHVKGYLLVDDEFEFKGNNIDEAYEQDIKNRNRAIANNLYQSLPTPLQKIIGQALNDPESITKATYMKILEEGSEVFDNSYDEDNEESIRNFLSKELAKEGRDEDEIEDLLDLWEDRGKLQREAARMDEKLNKRRDEENKKRIEQDKIEAARRKEGTQAFVSNVHNILQSSKMQAKRKNLIQSYIFDRLDGTDSTPLVYTIRAIYENPEALVQLADMVSYYNVKNGTWDMSKFEKKAVTAQTEKAKKSIEEKLSGQNAFRAKGSSKKKQIEFNWEDIDA